MIFFKDISESKNDYEVLNKKCLELEKNYFDQIKISEDLNAKLETLKGLTLNPFFVYLKNILINLYI